MYFMQNKKRMREKYNLDTLLDDIQNGFKELAENEKAGDKAKREGADKLIIMQVLIKLAQVFSGNEYKNDEKLRRDIVTKLNGNELLSGFLFFISLNPQFDYSWSYMRKRKLGYADYLVDVIRFINNVVADVNVLAEEATEENEIHVMINELFDVELSDVGRYVKTKVKWENFQYMASVKKEYTISVCRENLALATGNRVDTETVIKLKTKAIKRLANSQIITK